MKIIIEIRLKSKRRGKKEIIFIKAGQRFRCCFIFNGVDTAPCKWIDNRSNIKWEREKTQGSIRLRMENIHP